MQALHLTTCRDIVENTTIFVWPVTHLEGSRPEPTLLIRWPLKKNRRDPALSIMKWIEIAIRNLIVRRFVKGKDANPGSHFLRDIVIVTQPGANLSFGHVRQAIASVDPSLPIATVRTMSDQVSSQFMQQRLIARLTLFFGMLSLVLASIGLYGVTAYNAGRRTGEIGVRIALGASRGDVVRLVLRGAFLLILIGLGLGLPLTSSRPRVNTRSGLPIKPTSLAARSFSASGNRLVAFPSNQPTRSA